MKRTDSKQLGLFQTKPERAGPENVSLGGKELKLNLTGGSHLSGHLTKPNRYATLGSRSDGYYASSSSVRAELTGVAETSVRRRGHDGEEAELAGEVADRRWLLDSSTSHQQQLQWRPKSSRTRRRSRAELGQFRGREEERRVGIGCGGCVLPLGVIDGVFYSRGRPGARRPVRGQCGGPGGVRRSHRARRPRGCAGGLSPWLRRAMGRCWRGHGGRERAEKKKDWEGALGALHFFPPLLMARVGAEGAGLDRGASQEHGYRSWTHGDSDHHSS
jgi:hypothetical protein